MLIIVPAILWVTPHYGAQGAAVVWVCLNVGYVLIGIQFMHRRILTKEKWRWYWQDLMQPLAPAVMVALLGKMLWPTAPSMLENALAIAAVGAATLAVAALSSKHIRAAMVDSLRLSIVKAERSHTS